MATSAERIARFVSTLSYDALPPEVADAAKYHLLDTIGCGLAASALGISTAVRDVIAEMGGAPDATVIGLADPLPAPNAALANGTLCHALDFDDTHSGSICHVSAVVVPATLAAAQAAGASGADAVAAVVGGNETIIRLGLAAPGAFHERGFHPTAVCGVFGAAAAAARVAGLDESVTTHALGIAGSFASGNLEYLGSGAAIKRVHAGWAAHGAVLAAALAARGIDGPPTIFEGRFGLYATYLGTANVDLDAQVDTLGNTWETPRIAYKPYPACHYIHGCLGAATELLRAERIRPEEIDEVVATVPAAAVPMVLEPAETKRAPRTEYEAKFSVQFSLAWLLVHGEVGVSAYTTEAIADPDVLELASRVRYEVRDYVSYPGAFPGGVRIVTVDGRTLAADLEYQYGAPENPLPPELVREKYRGNASLALSEADVEQLEEAILTLESQPDLSLVLSPIARAAGSLATPA